MVYSAAKFQQSNTYQYPTDKKVRKLFEVPAYIFPYNDRSPKVSNFHVFRPCIFILHLFLSSLIIVCCRVHHESPYLVFILPITPSSRPPLLFVLEGGWRFTSIQIGG